MIMKGVMKMIKCLQAIEDNAVCQQCCMFCEKRKTCDEVCTSLIDSCEYQIHPSEMKIPGTVQKVIDDISELAVQKKSIEDQEKKMKEKLVKAMEKYDVKSFENDRVKFMYVAPSERKSIDSAKLKKQYHDIAEECTKVSPVKSSVRITVKK